MSDEKTRSSLLAAIALLALIAPARAQHLTSARVDPLVIRDGVDTYRWTVTVSDPNVVAVTVETNTYLTKDGAPVASVTLTDDGLGGDEVAGDGVLSAGNIGLQRQCDSVGAQLLNSANVEFRFADSTTVSSPQSLGLTFYCIGPSVPIPVVADLAPDARATDYVLALNQPLSGSFPFFSVSHSEVTRRFYDLLPDDRDWLLLALPFNVAHAPAAGFAAVRNDVSGIGSPIFDDSGLFGSAGSLRGVILDFAFAVLVHTTVNHEVAHQFAARLDPSLNLSDGSSHWDLIARPTSVLSGAVTHLDFVSGNTYWAFSFGPDLRMYSDLELYLMGLIDVGDVASPIETLVNPVVRSIGPLRCDLRGCDRPFVVEADALRAVTTSEILQAEGNRVPGSEEAPKSFRMGLVVVYDRLLTDVELALYDYAIRQYEKATSGIGTSFADATGHRATMSTVLLAAGGCPDDAVSDCLGNCAPADWLGDGRCDDGFSSTADLNCLHLAYDDRDCVMDFDIYVEAAGDCAGLTPCTASLQAAVDGAAGGDSIGVASGTYPQQIRVDRPGVAVAIEPGWDGAFTSRGRPALTIGAADASGGVLVQRLTITAGRVRIE